MELAELQVFLTVAAERSFSRAAKKLHRTQPAVSQAIKRLEDELGERLFDRSSRHGALTEAGLLLQQYAGRVAIGANEAAVHSLLPAIQRFAASHPQVHIEVRRVPSREIASELLERSI